MLTRIGMIAAVACLVLGGCASETDTADTTQTNTSTPAAGSGDAVAMQKCSGCGGEFPAVELASHDGTMMCKKCIDSHGH